jgi:hypothetical protein
MKISTVLTSLLFGSFATTTPFDRRSLVYKSEVVTNNVVVYTTTWDDKFIAQATTNPAGYFYEQPKDPSNVALKLNPTHLAPAEKKPTVAPTALEPATIPCPSPVPTPRRAPSVLAPAAAVEQPKPVEEPPATKEVKPNTAAPQLTTATSACVAPPAYTEAPATPTPSLSALAYGTLSTGGSMEHENVDITIYDPQGNPGACGTAVKDSDPYVALSQGLWGASTYDVMTGVSTNPWCGQKISIVYEGHEPIVATVMDLCPGCKGPQDIDLSPSLWNEVTNGRERTRLKASWSKIN